MNNEQLFCFTYAGGNADFYEIIEKDLAELDVVKLEYAGHGLRHNEPFYENFDDLAEDMYSKIRESYSGHGYGLFGYSMGAICLVEVLIRILRDSKFSNPKYVFLAAHEPHTKSELADYSSCELDELVKERTVKFGAIPEVLLKNDAFWRMYLPRYRADYSLIGRYMFDNLNLQTNIPAVVFYSASDTPTEDMMEWRQYFVGVCDFYRFDGTHFFIREHHKEIAEIISNKLNGRVNNEI